LGEAFPGTLLFFPFVFYAMRANLSRDKIRVAIGFVVAWLGSALARALIPAALERNELFTMLVDLFLPVFASAVALTLVSKQERNVTVSSSDQAIAFTSGSHLRSAWKQTLPTLIAASLISLVVWNYQRSHEAVPSTHTAPSIASTPAEAGLEVWVNPTTGKKVQFSSEWALFKTPQGIYSFTRFEKDGTVTLLFGSSDADPRITLAQFVRKNWVNWNGLTFKSRLPQVSTDPDSWEGTAHSADGREYELVVVQRGSRFWMLLLNRDRHASAVTDARKALLRTID
jgi:hypothetical protein